MIITQINSKEDKEMTKERLCLVGRDDDDWIWVIIIAVIDISIIVTLVVYGGVFIGGF